MELYLIAFSVFIANAIAFILRRVSVPPIAAYIFTGILLGPSVLGVVQDVTEGQLITFSLLLLLFYTGLNVDFKGLRNYLGLALETTLIGVGFTVGITVAAMTWAGFGLLPSLVVGISLGNTATEVVVIMLHHSYGVSEEFRRVLVMASFMDDIVAIVFMSLLAGVISGDVAGVGADLLKITGFMATFLLAAYFIFVKNSSRIYRLVIEWDMFVMLASLIFFGTLVAARATGISDIMGAYVAGLVLSTLRLIHDPTLVYTVRVEELMSRVTTVLDLFVAPIFFVFVGYATVVSYLMTPTFGMILALAIIGKTVGSSLPHIIRGRYKEALAIGIAMNVRGSIEPALALLALSYGVIGPQLYTSIIGVSLMTSAIIPVIFNILTWYEEV